MLQRAGFIVENLRESRLRREHFISEENFQRNMKISLLRFLVGRK
jgi:hypothetical protein